MIRYCMSWRLLLVIVGSCVGQSLIADDEGISMFNGQDLTGWRGDAHWSVEDGAITGKTTPQTLLKYNTFLIWEGGTPQRF